MRAWRLFVLNERKIEAPRDWGDRVFELHDLDGYN
jgi:hypothetical protein